MMLRCDRWGTVQAAAPTGACHQHTCLPRPGLTYFDGLDLGGNPQAIIEQADGDGGNSLPYKAPGA